MAESNDATTSILLESRADRALAPDRLLPVVYPELRALAADFLARERPGHTLQPTALVHEAWLRLADATRLDWRDRAHFIALAARTMRRILVDHARARGASKRGGGRTLVDLDEAQVPGTDGAIDLLELDDALERLAALHDRQARVVEARYFGGLTIEETAEALAIARSTVADDWTAARAWLLRELAR